MPPDLVEVGRIVAAHGVRGALKVAPYSAQAAGLTNARQWWLSVPGRADGAVPPSGARLADVRHCRQQSGGPLIVELQGVDDRNQAEALRGAAIWVRRGDFPATQADEYYWVDLIGCDFYTLVGGRRAFVGRVAQVLDNGAQAVLQVLRGMLGADGKFHPVHDGRGRPRYELVPFVSAYIGQVDLDARSIDSHWLVDTD